MLCVQVTLSICLRKTGCLRNLKGDTRAFASVTACAMYLFMPLQATARTQSFLAEISKIELNPSTFFLPEMTTEITGLLLPYKKCVSGSEADVVLPFLVLILK